MREDNLVSNIIPHQTRSSSAISSATSFVLDSETTLLEVSAESQAVFLKYGAGVTTADGGFHEKILAGQTRMYPVAPGITISVIEAAATATVTLIERVM